MTDTMTGTMHDLRSQQCSNISAEDNTLTQEDIIRLNQQLSPPWELDAEEKSISHSYSFENFYQTMAFVNVIAQIAHQQDHHPGLAVSYNRCTVRYSTHSVGGLSINDFICAAKINSAQSL